MITIYIISNNKNGKCYVGQTQRFVDRRWREHIADARRNSKHPLHRAIRKYGADNFYCRPLLICTTKEEADLSEKYFVFAMRSAKSEFGYNGTHGGDAPSMTEETRKKMSASHTGKKRSVEQCTAMSAAQRARNQCPSEETREKLRKARLGKKCSAETRTKMSHANISSEHYGKTRETLAKFHAEATKKAAAAHLGKVPWNKGKTRR